MPDKLLTKSPYEILEVIPFDCNRCEAKTKNWSERE